MDPHSRQRAANWALALLATILLLLGIAMAAGGGYLVYLGGSGYFLITGIVIIVAAFLIFRHSPLGIWLFALSVLGTFAWSLWEINAKGWLPVWQVDLMARTGLLAVLMALALILLPVLQRRAGKQRRLYVGPVLGVVIITGFAGITLWLIQQSGVSGSSPVIADDSPPVRHLQLTGLPMGVQTLRSVSLKPIRSHQAMLLSWHRPENFVPAIPRPAKLLRMPFKIRR